MYANLRNGQQHTIPSDLSKKEAIEYAIELFGRYQILEIIDENTGENII